MIFQILFLSFGLWTPTELSTRLEEVKKAHFPELIEKEVFLEPKDLQRSFFATDVKNIFRFWRERRYAVQYNPKVLESELSEAAIDAILAHELVHIRSYLSLSRLELIGLALRYHFGSDEFRTEFERNTDLEAVDLGFAAGLRDYRLWLYEQLDPQAVAEKKRLYLRPEELEEISLKTPAVE